MIEANNTETLNHSFKDDSDSQPVSEQALPTNRIHYSQTELEDASAHQSRFYDEDYNDSIVKMASLVIEVQSPVRDDVVVTSIARAHGFPRTLSKIRERVLSLLSKVTSTDEAVGKFFWRGSAPLESVPFRYHLSSDERRSVDEISIPEFIGLLKSNPALGLSDDPVQAVAREIGLARVSKNARERLEQVLAAVSGNSA